MDRRAWNGPLYLFVEGNEERSRRICGMTEAMTARCDHDGPSIQLHFDRFSVIRILLLLGFCFYK